MSSTAPTADSAPVPTLADLRAQLDQVDDALHDLLMRRADIVGDVARLAAQGKIAFRPGREADILRRLLARHAGGLPRRALPRLWRELFAATTAMQGGFVVAVGAPEPAAAYIACAREHFGALTPLRAHGSPARAIAEVSAGAAAVAVLPLPQEGEPPSAAWWTTLLHQEEPRLHIAARLPFWAPRPEGAPQVQALVVAAAAPDPSGADRTLLGVELSPEMSRTRLAAAAAAAGLAPMAMILCRDAGAPVAHGLIEVEGHMEENDARLAALAERAARPLVLGAYAVPLEGDPP
jgi:chorismate mutase/prephenate dehydratase